MTDGRKAARRQQRASHRSRRAQVSTKLKIEARKEQGAVHGDGPAEGRYFQRSGELSIAASWSWRKRKKSDADAVRR
ncbi:MAG: hypothetical protein ACLRTA_03650 [Clostridia bacterium]